MSAAPALVVEPEYGDGDGGPPDDPCVKDFIARYSMFQRTLQLVWERGPLFQQLIQHAWEEALVEHNQDEPQTEKET